MTVNFKYKIGDYIILNGAMYAKIFSQFVAENSAHYTIHILYHDSYRSCKESEIIRKVLYSEIAANDIMKS